MRITAISDIHLRNIDSWGVIQEGINSRLRDRINILKFAINYGIENKSDLFVIGGDICDKMNPSESLRKIFIETAVIPLVNAGIPIVLVVGNHDTNFSISSFETDSLLLDSVKEGILTFVSSPIILDIQNNPIYFIPYGADIPQENEGCRILFGHHGIEGAETGVGVKQRAGEEKQALDFKAFEYTFLGHYHKPQELITSYQHNRIIYIGSTNIWDMGERLDKKRLLDITVEDKITIKSILLPERKFLQLEIKEGESWEFTDDIRDACVKTIYRGSRKWINSLDFESIRRAYEQFSPHRVIPEIKIIDEQRVSKEIFKEGETLEAAIIRECERRGMSEEEIRLGLDIFNSINA